MHAPNGALSLCVAAWESFTCLNIDIFNYRDLKNKLQAFLNWNWFPFCRSPNLVRAFRLRHQCWDNSWFLSTKMTNMQLSIAFYLTDCHLVLHQCWNNFIAFYFRLLFFTFSKKRAYCYLSSVSDGVCASQIIHLKSLFLWQTTNNLNKSWHSLDKKTTCN